MWDEVQKAIVDIMVKKEHLIVEAVSSITYLLSYRQVEQIIYRNTDTRQVLKATTYTAISK